MLLPKSPKPTKALFLKNRKLSTKSPNSLAKADIPLHLKKWRKKAITIVSGGQTGVDRAALDFALFNSLKISGFCPKGRIAEDGIIPLRYPLRQVESGFYSTRTILNVKTSDATLIFYHHHYDRGTKFTILACRRLKKPCLTIDLRKPDYAALKKFLSLPKIGILNIAGIRQSSFRGAYDLTLEVLNRVFTR